MSFLSLQMIQNCLMDFYTRNFRKVIFLGHALQFSIWFVYFSDYVFDWQKRNHRICPCFCSLLSSFDWNYHSIECISHPPPLFHHSLCLFSWLALTSSMKWTWGIWSFVQNILTIALESKPQSWQSVDSPPPSWLESQRHLCSTAGSSLTACWCPSPPQAHTSPSPPSSTCEARPPLQPTSPCQTSCK